MNLSPMIIPLKCLQLEGYIIESLQEDPLVQEGLAFQVDLLFPNKGEIKISKWI